MPPRIQGERGVSLVELLIAIIIIAILSVVVATNLSAGTDRNHLKKALSRISPWPETPEEHWVEAEQWLGPARDQVVTGPAGEELMRRFDQNNDGQLGAAEASRISPDDVLGMASRLAGDVAAALRRRGLDSDPEVLSNDEARPIIAKHLEKATAKKAQ